MTSGPATESTTPKPGADSPAPPSLDSQQELLWRRYSAALGMVQTEEASVWQRFTVFLFSNLILLSATLWNQAGLARTVLPIFGLVLGYFWLAITMRGFTFQRYYSHYCKQLEQDMGEHALMSLAIALAEEGATITLNGIKMRVPTLAQPVLGRHAAYAIVGMFITIYIALALHTFWG